MSGNRMPQSSSKKGKKSSFKSDHDDIWDDSLLIKAYDESVKLQNEEVAKQLAMKTNKKMKPEDIEEGSETSDESTTEEFKAGDFVRCRFADDGVDYEAEVLKLNDNGNCTVKYIGYGNEERVKMDDLVASWGPEAREEQKILAEADQQNVLGSEDHQEELHTFIVGKTREFHETLPIPPMPPMPPAMFDNSRDSEYMSAMIMSWYMSGYYTGLYHGRKQARDEMHTQPSTSARPNHKESPKKKKKNHKNN